MYSSTQAAVEPVWYLPALAERFGVTEMKLRETLFIETNMMYPELITRPDLKVGSYLALYFHLPQPTLKIPHVCMYSSCMYVFMYVWYVYRSSFPLLVAARSTSLVILTKFLMKMCP